MERQFPVREAECGDNAIDRRATEWVARLDRLDVHASDCPELQEWLAEDPRHQGAFLRAQAAWVSLGRVVILGPNLVGADQDYTRSPILRRTIVAGLAISTVSFASLLTFFFWPRASVIQTQLGEIRRFPLEDGSLATVNTNSELRIVITDAARKITLNRGEVWFDVAEDRKCPFIVSAGDMRVRATGTAFSVRRREAGVDVLVTDGSVETWLSGAGNRKRVPAGSKVFVSDLAGPSEVIPAAAEIKRALAWRNGEIELDGETLAEAAAEFNRYNVRKLTVDPAIANKRVVGWFHTNEPESFAAAASAALGIAVIASGREVYLGPGPLVRG